jgi:hypothetical protein
MSFQNEMKKILAEKNQQKNIELRLKSLPQGSETLNSNKMMNE